MAFEEATVVCCIFYDQVRRAFRALREEGSGVERMENHCELVSEAD